MLIDIYVLTHILLDGPFDLRGDRMSKHSAIDWQLKDVIRTCGKTHYRIAKDANISPDIVDRFMHGQRDLRLATAAKICAALNLELQPIDDKGT